MCPQISVLNFNDSSASMLIMEAVEFICPIFQYRTRKESICVPSNVRGNAGRYTDIQARREGGQRRQMPRGLASIRGPVVRARNQLMKHIIISYTKFTIYTF